MSDPREILFSSIQHRNVTACIYTEADGTLSGVSQAVAAAQALGLTVDYILEEGARVSSGDLIMQIKGHPIQIADAEDHLIGCLSKTSGIATAASRFVAAAGQGVQIVCGSWKKMPVSIKDNIRQAVLTGGASCRISDVPMVYLDKNYVAMLGGIQASLSAAAQMEERKKVIQIRGRYEAGDLVREAWAAIHAGADIVYVDTGRIQDAIDVVQGVKPTLQQWQQQFQYRPVKIAFGGGVTLEDIPVLRDAGVDIIGVGRQIIDAPLMDMRMEVTSCGDRADSAHSYDLLDKSELKIEGIQLCGTNLTQLAAVVAEEIGIDASDVLVIDVRDQAVALDILRKQLDPYLLVGKESAILRRLSTLDGVTITEDTHITSHGMLGWIARDDCDVEAMYADLSKAFDMAQTMKDRIANRVIVFPSGIEVEQGEIEDTNTPMLIETFRANGFEATAGEVLKDDIDLFSGKLRMAVEQGYGLIITTGGVGAEDKDHSVEAILRLDHGAAAPYIVKFKRGEGRHRKDGIRIAVGQVGSSLLVALPGPNDEVALCMDTLVKGVRSGWSKEVLASMLAKLLRQRLLQKMGHHPAHHSKPTHETKSNYMKQQEDMA